MNQQKFKHEMIVNQIQIDEFQHDQVYEHEQIAEVDQLKKEDEVKMN